MILLNFPSINFPAVGAVVNILVGFLVAIPELGRRKQHKGNRNEAEAVRPAKCQEVEATDKFMKHMTRRWNISRAERPQPLRILAL